MKIKVLGIINLILSAVLVISIAVYCSALYYNGKQKAFLQESREAVASSDELYRLSHRSSASTADEITALKREIAELQDRNEETKIKEIIVSYLNTRYNFEGTMSENYSRIVKELEKYTDNDYLYNQVTKNMNIGAGNAGASGKRKKVKNFCTEDDIYFTVDQYDDGSDVFMAICEIHDTGRTMYREINVVAYDDGIYKVNYDAVLFEDKLL